MTDSQEPDDVAAEQAAPSPGESSHAASPAAPATSAPAPTPAAPPTPANVPTPATVPTPGTVPTPAQAVPAKAAPAPAASAASEAAAVAASKKFGRAEADGHVVLLLDGEEIPVGQYPGASADEALEYFAKKFAEILAQVDLLNARIAAKAPAAELSKTISHLRGQVDAHTAVGDVKGTLARLDEAQEQVSELDAAAKAAAAAARDQALAEREELVSQAEKLAAQDPSKIQWKTTGAHMNELFESWKAAQHSGPRLGKSTEDELWKRFRAARTTFDRHRRAYFSALDSNNAVAKSAKESLIERAEALSDSTDWGATAGEYRRLMDEWKAAPRASRKQDDALWTRFRAAQDKFFNARKAANDQIDAEYSQNLVVKEELLKEAQGILPVKDVGAARKALQSIRDRWEDAGKVPREAMSRMEGGLRSVENAVKDAEDAHWKRTDPEAKARTNSALSQLESAIEGLEQDLAKAQSQGNAAKIKKAQEALDARRAWLEQVKISASQLG